jgi:HAD superfamily hydrolase (TIGR01549 family)
MMRNDGSDTNENIFWQSFEAAYGEQARSRESLFNDFYNNEFQNLSSLCGVIEDAAWAVRTIREMGYRTVLATNPVFPPIATESRMRWAGLEPSDFEFYTTYVNSSYAKPNPEYYLEIAEKLGLSPSECLMVGNDTTDDMVAETVGMSVYLLPEYLINKSGADISTYNYGNLKNLVAFIENLKLRMEN